MQLNMETEKDFNDYWRIHNLRIEEDMFDYWGTSYDIYSLDGSFQYRAMDINEAHNIALEKFSNGITWNS